MSNSTIYKHTPGPWRVVREARDLAVVIPGGAALHEWPANYCQQDVCDAHLIAAAPDLLSAAQSALLILQYFGDEHSRLAEQIEAAIAKAIGK